MRREKSETNEKNNRFSSVVGALSYNGIEPFEN